MAKFNQSVIDLLFDEAQENIPVANARVMSAIVYKNKIIALGRNKNKSHPFQKKYCHHPEAILIHAENDAIVKALKRMSVEDLSKASIYIVRAKRDVPKGKFRFGLARPCPGCESAIASYNIKNVFYSNDEGDIECL